MSGGPGLRGRVLCRWIGVTEFLANPGAVTDANGEWIELFNAGPNPILYDTISLADAVSDFEAITVGSGLLLNVGETLLVARNADGTSNGGLTNVGGLFSFFLNNTGDTIYVRVGDQIVDTLDYTGFGNSSGCLNSCQLICNSIHR